MSSSAGAEHQLTTLGGRPLAPYSREDAVRGQRARRRRNALVGYLFLLPSLLVFLVFRHGPAVASLVIGFFEWSIIDDAHFIGFENYANLLHDEIFWRTLRVTGMYTVLAVPPDIVIALGLALLLNQAIRGITLFRLAYFLPVVTATAIVAVIWRWLYQPRGIINGLIGDIGFEPQLWLANPDLALVSIAIMAVWKHVGFNMLIFLAALQAIPQELEEAARLDGATPRAIFFHIKLPLLRPVLVLVTILTTIGSLQVFDAAYVMTAGGPYYATSTLVYYTYTRAFDQYQAGYASAIGTVLFLIILAVTLIQRLVLKGDDNVY